MVSSDYDCASNYFIHVDRFNSMMLFSRCGDVSKGWRPCVGTSAEHERVSMS